MRVYVCCRHQYCYYSHSQKHTMHRRSCIYSFMHICSLCDFANVLIESVGQNAFCSVLVLWEPKMTESRSCWIQIAACVTGEQLSCSLWYGYIKMYIYIFFVVGIYDSNIAPNHSEVSSSINPLKSVVKLGINNFITYLSATYIRSQHQYEKKYHKKIAWNAEIF